MITEKFDDFIRAFLKMAKDNAKYTDFKIWIEEKIYQIGRTIYLNNFPDFPSDFRNRFPLIICSENEKLIKKLMESNQDLLFLGFNNHSLKPRDGQVEIFTKLLEVISHNFLEHRNNIGNFKGVFIILLGFTDYLFKDQINCNLYNLKSSEFLLKFINISNLKNEKKLNIINLNNDNQIHNNISFINPIAIRISKKIKDSVCIFDVFFGKSIEYESILKLIEFFKNKLLN
ncbi:MAG: hypothetical protein ACTSR3_12715 [Candidatus Helarchaeota archaeon]